MELVKDGLLGSTAKTMCGFVQVSFGFVPYDLRLLQPFDNLSLGIREVVRELT